MVAEHAGDGVDKRIFSGGDRVGSIKAMRLSSALREAVASSHPTIGMAPEFPSNFFGYAAFVQCDWIARRFLLPSAEPTDNGDNACHEITMEQFAQ